MFHKAQSSKAHPLAYDFMEIMRSLMIDDVLLKMVHKKKKPVTEVTTIHIAAFIYRIKNKEQIRYYHKKLGYCITLEYWMRLLLLEFMGSVRKNIPYNPIFPSIRHESRCKATK